jgi:enoyl-CoA hydratase
MDAANQMQLASERWRTVTLTLDSARAVATLTLQPLTPNANGSPAGSRHQEVAEAMHLLRLDDRVRVVILTNAGETFMDGRANASWDEAVQAHRNKPDVAVDDWQTFASVVRTHEAMAAMEKPIVGRIAGHARGFGSSMLFSCDLVIARDDIEIADYHLDVASGGPGDHIGLVPGDGGSALVPLHMPPMLAKEYLLLGRPFRPADLVSLGVINYAVPAAELDAKVGDIVDRLLARPAYALAWTKRLVNHHIMQRIPAPLDAGVAYEMVNVYQYRQEGWRQSTALVDEQRGDKNDRS